MSFARGSVEEGEFERACVGAILISHAFQDLKLIRMALVKEG